MTDAINTNRADMLRKRRIQAEQQRGSQVAKRTVTTQRGQPVTQRRASAPVNSRSYRSVPVVQKARTNARRQYYYTVGNTGAEIRLPAIPVIKFGPRLVSGLLALLLCAVMLTLVQSSTFEVNQVMVNGLQRVSSEEITATLDITGESIFVFDQQEAYNKIKVAFPELKDVKINVGLPAIISLTASERTPILTWQVNDQAYWMDEEGVIFPVRGAVDGLPVVQADAEPPLAPITARAEDAAKQPAAGSAVEETVTTVLGQTIDPRVLDVTLKMLPQIPAGGSLIYNRLSGLGWADPNGWSVYIGRTLEDIDMKMVEYQAIVSYLGTQGVSPSVISVESIYAPFYRTEQ